MSLICKIIVAIIVTTYGANCGILTGDLKLKSRPLSIKTHHSPINININTDKLKATLPSISLPKPAKPPPKSLSDLLRPSIFSKPVLPELPTLFPSKTSKLFRAPSLTESIFPSKSNSIFASKSILPSLSKPSLLSSPKLPKLPSLTKSILPMPKLSVPILPPVIPKVPLLPLPLLPIIPPLPLIPLIPPFIPRMPLIPRVLSLSPLKVPILGGKSLLQQALGSELKPVIAECADTGRKVIMEKKLRNLLKRGSLTTAEFNRFRRILLG